MAAPPVPTRSFCAVLKGGGLRTGHDALHAAAQVGPRDGGGADNRGADTEAAHLQDALSVDAGLVPWMSSRVSLPLSMRWAIKGRV